ncbi:hypothetical protein EZV62_004197 [Acer yangbiense]|uniref:F-box associated beta-propeller type 1 domain-containing protein n=1 Tax=Acer yangbiense TaxID=1000413 RepID=A0A5C7IKW9_9ROSI|nr:hypothetical protein EZV62_004197 [Acer yangbiense]
MRVLPKCRFVVPHDMGLYFSVFGCGYDPLSDDYKLVFLRLFHDECGDDDFLDPHVSLYSFNNDSWRDLQVPELRHYFWANYFRKNSCLNGVCYWLAMRNRYYENVILSFDISSEIFEETNLPEYGLDCRTLEAKCQLKQLSLVDLSHNNLSGHIPHCLDVTSLHDNSDIVEAPTFLYTRDRPMQQLVEVQTRKGEALEFTTKTISYSYQGKVLTYISGIDLSGNRLTGSIPQEIGNLTRIHTLNLSHNNLTGPIPGHFRSSNKFRAWMFP